MRDAETPGNMKIEIATSLEEVETFPDLGTDAGRRTVPEAQRGH
jgi:hypothetical protein